MNEGRAFPDLDGIFRSLHLHNQAAEHAEPLDRIVGSWLVEGRCRPFGAGRWMGLAGEAEARWVVGGRYLQLSFAAEMDDVHLNAMCVMCYDPLIEQFLDCWFDNLGTGLQTAQGTYDVAARRLDMRRRFTNRVLGRTETVCTTWRFADPAAISCEWLRRDGDGDEWRPFCEYTMHRMPATPADGFRRML